MVTSLLIVGELDEIVVRVTDVEGTDRTVGSKTVHWALFDGYVEVAELGGDLIERSSDNQAEVGRARPRLRSVRDELVAMLVEIDLLVAQVHGAAPIGVDDLHAETPIEDAGLLNIGDSENEVIDAVELHDRLDA
jgi:hypothetical protein